MSTYGKEVRRIGWTVEKLIVPPFGGGLLLHLFQVWWGSPLRLSVPVQVVAASIARGFQRLSPLATPCTGGAWGPVARNPAGRMCLCRWRVGSVDCWSLTSDKSDAPGGRLAPRSAAFALRGRPPAPSFRWDSCRSPRKPQRCSAGPYGGKIPGELQWGQLNARRRPRGTPRGLPPGEPPATRSAVVPSNMVPSTLASRRRLGAPGGLRPPGSPKG